MNMTKKTLSIVISLLIVASSGAVIIYGALNHKENNEIEESELFSVRTDLAIGAPADFNIDCLYEHQETDSTPSNKLDDQMGFLSVWGHTCTGTCYSSCDGTCFFHQGNTCDFRPGSSTCQSTCTGLTFSCGTCTGYTCTTTTCNGQYPTCSASDPICGD